MKEALAKGLGGDTGGIGELARGQDARGVLEEAIEEGLVRVEQFANMGIQ